MDNGKANGAGAEKPEFIDTLVLTYDRQRDHLDIGGACASILLMLDILHRATLVLEGQWRREQAKELQKDLQQQAADAALRAQIQGRR